MTEAEARAKWCPLVSFTEAFTGTPSKNCAGSYCMMWRWDQGPMEFTVGDLPQTIKATYANPGNGYCGLAGKP